MGDDCGGVEGPTRTSLITHRPTLKQSKNVHHSGAGRPPPLGDKSRLLTERSGQIVGTVDVMCHGDVCDSLKDWYETNE